MGDHVLLKQKKKKKTRLSTTFIDVPYKVSRKYGNEVVVTSPEGANLRRNVTEVKKYLREADATGEQVAEDGVTEGEYHWEDSRATRKTNQGEKAARLFK